MGREQTATGGHLNMENFITGYPGHEYEMRAAMLEVLGKEKYEFFFDKVCSPLFYLSQYACVCVCVCVNELRLVSGIFLHTIRRQIPRLAGPKLHSHTHQPSPFPR